MCRLHRLLRELIPGGAPAAISAETAFGLLNDPELLLLDEPTASLDATNRAVVIDLIEARKRQGVAILGIFHDDEVRQRVADQIVDVTQFQPKARAYA